jgi:hypothetical protein
MTDRELLEAAAKAAGIALEWNDNPGYYSDWRGLPQWNHWNPLLDDGDALRLAVKLKLTLDTGDDASEAVSPIHWHIEQHKGDPLAATRRAIVRAAASMGGAE